MTRCLPSEIGLNIQTQMHNVNATAYLRVPFTVTNPADFATLRLTQRWNDGFIAYVNGTQITAQNAPPTPDWNSTATGTHSAGIVDTFDYTLPAGLLRAGTNILAIHGLNLTAADANFLMLPKLDGITAQVASRRLYRRRPRPARRTQRSRRTSGLLSVT